MLTFEESLDQTRSVGIVVEPTLLVYIVTVMSHRFFFPAIICTGPTLEPVMNSETGNSLDQFGFRIQEVGKLWIIVGHNVQLLDCLPN